MAPAAAVAFGIRAHVFAKRIRLSELFADFDKLRSGFITTSQFRRCLASAMETGAPLMDGEYKVLMNFYRGQGIQDGRVKWHQFVDSIDRVLIELSVTVFGAKKLELTPTQYIPTPHEVVWPVRRPLTPKSAQSLTEVIERLRQYVKHHGSDVKSWFTDFDKHKGGYITQNQFRRGIPQNLMSQEEEDLLVGQYCDNVTGAVNYFKMNTDVNRRVKPKIPNHTKLVAKVAHPEFTENEHVPIGTEELLHAVGAHNPAKPSREYFRAGIKLTELMLEEIHIKTVVDAYKDKEGRVAYRRFCQSIEEIFTKRNLEKNPLVNVFPPAKEFLMPGTNELAPAEEARCQEILARLRAIMKERRLMLAPFFEDYDHYLGTHVSRRVTRSQFSRLLSTMKLDMSDNDLHVLFKKFEDRSNAKVNYMEFIRTIDPETYVAYSNKPSSTPTTPNSRRAVKANPAISFQSLMDRIRYHAATKRIRVAEFFRDFDKLRCYSIPRHEFIRGINRIGLSLAAAEYESLADIYEDRTGKKGMCRWKDFEQDIERVFNDTGLESQPTKTPAVAPISTNPFLSADHLSDEEHIILRNTIKGIAEHMRIRQTSIKPFFQDFDKLCTGHVTKTQFRQCLTYLKVHVTDTEFEILCKRWKNSVVVKVAEDEALNQLEEEDVDQCCVRDPIKSGAERICYIMFLSELDELLAQPKDSHDAMREIKAIGGISLKAKDAATIANAKPLTAPVSKPNSPPKVKMSADDVQNLLTRIKLKAKTERIRVIDFMADFDHLKHGKITKNEFRRALKVLYLDLMEHELETLETIFQNGFDHGMVNYVHFSDSVESVFTFKGLINAPTMEPIPFIGYENGSVDPSLNRLTESEQKILEGTIARLREKVRERRIDILSYLEDFDFVKEGTITTNQFRSVLNTTNLPVDDAEITVLARRFTLDKNLDRVNYRAFSSAVAGNRVVRTSNIW
ncbi:hypothetical protein BC830DRAFT_1162449 [Chytriomyces sp. MP71]|nr:hypothetical protein BC830DRAFT_1162449 [Chytriomyces sp. MP71]